MTGIRNPEEIMKRYPFELSGGQQQRIVLAIALACRPSLLIADEPTTALDVTVQRQILDRLKRIAEETHTSVLLVSHDLGVVAALAKRILVMKDGEIIETGTAEEIFMKQKNNIRENWWKRQGNMAAGRRISAGFQKRSCFRRNISPFNIQNFIF